MGDHFSGYPPPKVGHKEGHEWKQIIGNATNFKCVKCGIIGYVKKSTSGRISDADIDTVYDCDQYIMMGVHEVGP